MIPAGVTAKALSTYLRHASSRITYDRYAHLMPGNEEESGALLDAVLQWAWEEPACAAGADQKVIEPRPVRASERPIAAVPSSPQRLHHRRRLRLRRGT